MSYRVCVGGGVAFVMAVGVGCRKLALNAQWRQIVQSSAGWMVLISDALMRSRMLVSVRNKFTYELSTGYI